MVSVPFPGPINVGGGIAIDTFEPAGIVHANIPTGHTATGGPLGRVFPVCYINAENFPDQIAINAFSGPNLM